MLFNRPTVPPISFINAIIRPPFPESRLAARFESLDGETLCLFQQSLSEDIILKTHLAPSIPPTHADPLRLKMVFMNLLINARDAITQQKPDNQTALFHPSRNGRHRSRPTAQNRPSLLPGQYTVVTIRDNGIGMDDNTLPHISIHFLRPNRRRKGGRIRSGSACAYGVIKEHRGCWM
jgi:signal transduction histidine kinase